MNINLEEYIRKGRDLIQQGKALGKDTEPLEKKVIALEERFNKHILNLKLPELSRRNIAIIIYSEVLGCEIWLCGNKKMAAQVKEDDPGAVIYTVDELRKLYKLQPSPEDLRAIHNIKGVIEGSRLEDSSLRADGS